MALASVNTFDDFVDKKRHLKTDDTEESGVRNNIGSRDRNVTDEKRCCELTELDNRLSDVSLNDACGENNSYCRYCIRSHEKDLCV